MRSTEAEEFTAFAQAAGWRLQRAAFVLTGDHHLAEDLAQATLAKVFAAWRRIKTDPLSYAYRTLSNTYTSHRRLRRNSERPVDWAEDRATGEMDPTIRLDIVVALGTLAPLDRAIVVLRYLEDLTVADTAACLEVGEGIVRVRSHRALKRLRPLLDEIIRTDS